MLALPHPHPLHAFPAFTKQFHFKLRKHPWLGAQCRLPHPTPPPPQGRVLQFSLVSGTFHQCASPSHLGLPPHNPLGLWSHLPGPQETAQMWLQRQEWAMSLRTQTGRPPASLCRLQGAEGGWQLPFPLNLPSISSLGCIVDTQLSWCLEMPSWVSVGAHRPPVDYIFSLEEQSLGNEPGFSTKPLYSLGTEWPPGLWSLVDIGTLGQHSGASTTGFQWSVRKTRIQCSDLSLRTLFYVAYFLDRVSGIPGWSWAFYVVEDDLEAGGFLSSRPAWSTGWVPGQPGLHRETLSRKTKKQNKQTKTKQTLNSWPSWVLSYSVAYRTPCMRCWGSNLGPRVCQASTLPGILLKANAGDGSTVIHGTSYTQDHVPSRKCPGGPVSPLPAASLEKAGFQVTQPEIKWQELEDRVFTSVGYLQLGDNRGICKWGPLSKML
jgi:hypothetical protein